MGRRVFRRGEGRQIGRFCVGLAGSIALMGGGWAVGVVQAECAVGVDGAWDR